MENSDGILLENSHKQPMKRVKMKENNKCKLHSKTYIRSLTREEVFSYIQKLHKIIQRQEKKLSKYKNKLRGKKKSKSVENEEGSPTKDKQLPVAKTFIEEITEAAQSAQNDTGFIYEPTSGLYYDQKTGYYYNAEYGLYYDGDNGCYYKYNQDKNEFQFHSRGQSQIEEVDKASPRLDDEIIKKSNAERRRKRKAKALKDNLETDKEDGEIESSSDDSLVVIHSNEYDLTGTFEDIAKKYPPSLRIIVQETSISKLKVGALFIITFKGGTLGREGNHDVIIPDLNVSKYHLKFSYNEEESIYQCVDLGSRNGTILNGKRMSNAKQESEPQKLVHGSVLQLSQTKLLCHIHSGNSTCGHCEPGLIIGQQNSQKVVTLSHKEQLKKLQKRYGLETEKYTADNKNESEYSDRAAARRDAVGSTNEYEKTQSASIETEISSENKGFKMLSKLGWNKGEALGKSSSGLLEPIPVLSNKGKKGLGCDDSAITVPLNGKDKKRTEKWKKAQERYNQLPVADIFANSDDSD